MAKPLASLPTARKIESMSDPQLVTTILRLTREFVRIKLLNNGSAPALNTNLLELARREATKRHLTINYPE